MKRWINLFVITIMSTLFFSLGCSTPKYAECSFTPDESNTLKFTSSKKYHTWVEMPGKDPSAKNIRETTEVILLDTTVESIDEAGNATIAATFSEVSLVLDTEVNGKIQKHSYSSTAKKTESTWPDTPALAGKSFKVKVAPDTSVLEVIGLDEMVKSLGVKEGEAFVVQEMISEESVKSYFEHPAVIMFADYGVNEMAKVSEKTPEKFEEAVENPDVMIKAQAIKNSYKAQAVEGVDGQEQVVFTMTGEPLHTLPEGVSPPQEPSNFGQSMIKNMATMNELDIKGKTVFDVTAGKVVSDDTSIDCTLLILGSSISNMGNNKNKSKDDGGTMFIVVSSNDTFEIVK